MSELPAKPLPEIYELTEPFWKGAHEGRLMMQKCSKCGTVNFHPKPWCIECGSRDIPWTEMRPEGTVYSYTISRAVAMNYPGWKEELPVIMCLVDIDGGARMYAQVTGIEPEAMQVGLRVTAYFDPISDDYSIPKFRPV
ncbi:MAG: acyl dehydratase [Hyphomicrobiales bacterium]|nr:MAG: acyl dehydratase [Hyphomicrobiales bacterium]